MKRRTLVQSNGNRRLVSSEQPRPAAHPIDTDDGAVARFSKPEVTRHPAVLSGLNLEFEAKIFVEVLSTISSVRGQP
ncbi:hypothetical protein [Pseudarthrobacter sp. H2]|uniref:hypothetical protein n=1 Tax=Pseudarthrobacter sp. H2 TaxID=3418415 RepID=UPI003CE75954